MAKRREIKSHKKATDLNLTKEYCLVEIDKFYEYLQKEGAITLKQIRKLSKFK